MDATGKCIIISAPSGAGKTTLVKHLLSKFKNLEFSVSATSRQKRDTETHGRDYYFITPAEFQNRIAKGDFLEWEEVYKDHYYGTLKSELERIWKKGHHVIFDVDVVGGLNLKKILGNSALAVFVMPPSIEHLHDRLQKRQTETPASLAKRVAKAAEEIKSADRFDRILVNDKLEDSCREATALVENFLK